MNAARTSAQQVFAEWSVVPPGQRCDALIGQNGRCDLRSGHPPIAEEMGWFHSGAATGVSR